MKNSIKEANLLKVQGKGNIVENSQMSPNFHDYA